MEISNIVFDTCRCYIQDQQALLGGTLTKFLLGSLRSRNVPVLAEAMSLFDPVLHGVNEFRILRQVSAFFKKNANLSNDGICSEAAALAFYRAERLCRITNRRLDHYYIHRDRLDPDLNLWLSKMEGIISSTLGRSKDFLELLPELIRVTSGATASRSRRDSLPVFKIGKKVECTPNAERYLQTLSLFYGYGALKCRINNWNRVEAVPKNWKTHRIIACEPNGNVPLQLAFDAYVKKRMLRIGVNLSSQFSNQELAREGSISGELATVDLSMASDTCAFNTVAWLFPQPWFQYLSDIRSSAYQYNGKHGMYAKFSSMGNGATFCIETLIFAAACKAVGSKKYSVYGDDIVIETSLYPKLTKLLAFLGFIINTEKSYSDGPFRESCGYDYYSGIDVTPFYFREVDKRKATLSHLVNGLGALGIGRSLGGYMLDLIDQHKLPLVPYNQVSTSGVWVDVSTAYALRLIRSKRSCLQYKALVQVEKSFSVTDSRSLFLWHLQRHYKTFYMPKPGSGKPKLKVEAFERGTISSRCSILRHKYVREWVGWFPPAAAVPLHLYWWSEMISRRKAEIVKF